MPTLTETQSLLWTLITAPEGVAAALADDDDRGGNQRARLRRTVRGDGHFDATARLDIYANMYFYRLLEVLADDYPAVATVVGADGFHNLITDYLLAHVSRHHSVRYAGASLPRFAAGHALNERFPFLADLAAFEWALVDAFDAPNAAVLTRADLMAVPPERWPGLRLTLHPAVQLLQSAWTVHRVRQRVDAGEDAGLPDAIAVQLCVWRQDFEVRYRALDESEWPALRVLERGGTFAAACEAGSHSSGDADATAQRLALALAGWVDIGLFTAAEIEGAAESETG